MKSLDDMLPTTSSHEVRSPTALTVSGSPHHAGLPHPLRSALRVSTLSAVSFSQYPSVLFHTDNALGVRPSELFLRIRSGYPFRIALTLLSLPGSTSPTFRNAGLVWNPDRLQGLCPLPKCVTRMAGATLHLRAGALLGFFPLQGVPPSRDGPGFPGASPSGIALRSFS